MNRFIAVLLLCCAALTAQAPRKKQPVAKKKSQPAQSATVFPLESLSIEGNRFYPSERIAAATGLKVGQPTDKTAFEAARDRLVATGVFASVGFRFGPSESGKGYSGVFEVTEVEPRYPVRFDSLPLPPENLREILSRADPFFGERIAASDTLINRYAALLQAELAKTGFADKVIGRVRSERPGEIDIVFQPATTPPAIAFVKFVNPGSVAASDLQNRMMGVAVGEIYREARIRELLNANIRPMYEAKGRVRVTFPKIESEPARDVKGLILTVHVEEGEPYNLAGVRVSGVPGDQLVKAAELKTGEVFNFNEVEAARQRILRAMRQKGYMQAKAEAQKSIDDKAKTVDVTFDVQPGREFIFGALRVEGLDLHTEPAIRKMWTLKSGEAFDAEYPDFFLAQVRERGIFDNLGETKSRIQVDEATGTVNVTLIFGGTRPEPKRKPQEP